MSDADRQRYNDDLETGLRFEDFVVDELYSRGIVLVGFSSRRYQRRGENMAGFEIKHDRLFRETGNFFIETAECPEPGMEMKPAGIYGDRQWMYVIGDHRELFLFATTTLVRIHQRGNHEEKTIPTAHGFLLPVRQARMVAARIIEPRVRPA